MGNPRIFRDFVDNNIYNNNNRWKKWAFNMEIKVEDGNLTKLRNVFVE